MSDDTKFLAVSYSVAGAALAVGQAEGKIRAHVKSGRIQAKREGRDIIIPRASLEAYVDGMDDYLDGAK